MKNSKPDQQKNAPCKLTFIGAALEVTGSCHLVEANDQRILLDCGMRQGGSAARQENNNQFDFDPGSIDMVVLSHAHLDHSGSLPKLVRAGFDGPIYCTLGTARLLRILLEDSYHLYSHDLEWRNKRRTSSGKAPIEAVYSETDVKKALSLCKTSNYATVQQISEHIQLQFFDAGHILGSAIVELVITTNGADRTLVFSGDLGNAATPLMPDPAVVEHADLVLLESTYGNRNHRSQADTLKEFREVLAAAKQEAGNILIPAFAVGRTQELLFQLGCLYQEGLLDGWRVFLDSPMAAAVTEVYDDCMYSLDAKDTDLMHSFGSISLEQFLPILSISESVEESRLINEIESGAIIIAGSGMCTGGRIRHHFKQRIWRRNTHIIFVGFQAEGTLGKRLVDGAETVRFFHQDYAVSAKIHTIGGFSAHAGQQQLIAWAENFKQHPKLFLVHGEHQAVIELRNQLMQQSGIEAEIAVKGSSVYF